MKDKKNLKIYFQIKNLFLKSELRLKPQGKKVQKR